MTKRIFAVLTAAALCVAAGCVYRSEEKEGPTRVTRYVEREPADRVNIHVDPAPAPREQVDVHVHDYR